MKEVLIVFTFPETHLKIATDDTQFASGHIIRKKSLSHAFPPEILSNIPPERYWQKKSFISFFLKIPPDDIHNFLHDLSHKRNTHRIPFFLKPSKIPPDDTLTLRLRIYNTKDVPPKDTNYALLDRQLFVMLASVFSVIVYRIAVGLAIYQTDSDFIRRNAKLATSVTAAFINLVLIIMFNFVSSVDSLLFFFVFYLGSLLVSLCTLFLGFFLMFICYFSGFSFGVYLFSFRLLFYFSLFSFRFLFVLFSVSLLFLFVLFLVSLWCLVVLFLVSLCCPFVFFLVSIWHLFVIPISLWYFFVFFPVSLWYPFPVLLFFSGFFWNHFHYLLYFHFSRLLPFNLLLL